MSNNDFTQSFDAQEWAKAFVERASKDHTFATDESNMIGWFANALMRGYDEHARLARAKSTTTDALNEMVERDANAVASSVLAEIARANQWPDLLGAHRALLNVRRLAYVMVNGEGGMAVEATKPTCNQFGRKQPGNMIVTCWLPTGHEGPHRDSSGDEVEVAA
jgi:hypothetical protein